MPDGQDSFSQAFDQAAAPPPQAAPQQPPPQPTGDSFTDAFNQAEAPTKQPGKIGEAQKSWWDWADRSILETSDGYTAKRLAQENEVSQKIIFHEIAQAHPWRAALAQMYYGTLDDVAKLGLSLTSPKMLALQGLGLFGRAGKAVGLLANTYFAWRGAESLHEERQANETQADYIQRQLFAASAIAGGTGGAGADVEGIAAMTKQAQLNKLGLSGDLAGKVQQKMDAIAAIRQKAELENAQGASDVMDTEQQMKTQAPERMGQIVRDAAHAVYQENARVSKPFEEMAAATEKPVSDAPTIRATILDVLKSHGVQDQEIPPKIFNALPKRGVAPSSFMDIPGGTTAMEVPELAEGFEDLRKPVSFKDLTRVREDLWDAKASATDGTLRNAFADAYDSITQMQEDYAQKNGFGAKYRQAKNDYRDFKRGLGSGLMSDFLRAEDYKQQAMTPKIAKLTTGVHADALRGLLKLAGVDTTPLDELTGGKPVKAAIGEIQKGAAKEAAARTAGAEKQARALGKQEPIIPGRSDVELAGKSTEEIRTEAIHRLANNMKQAGISNPMAMFMLIFGSIRLGMGSPFGVYAAGRGGAGVAKSLRSRLMNNPSYQDWLIRESGVDPTNLSLIGKLRQGLKRLAASGALAGAAAKESNAPD